MEIKKTLDLESLNPEERQALDSGEKTEEDLIAEHEAKEKEEADKKEEEYNKAKELAENYKIRAEKAEAEAKKAKSQDDSVPKKEELSQIDLLALVRANVSDDDISAVTDYAKLKKITVKEALGTDFIKSWLADKEEERKTAEATATKQKRAGVTAPSGSELLRQAEDKGELPESKEDMEKLTEARFQKKSARK